MEPLHLPFFSLDANRHRYAVFLPGFRVDEVEGIRYEFDPEEEILRIFCRYGEGESQHTEVYPIAISDLNRAEFEDLKQLAVFNPHEYEPAELTDDPDTRRRLKEFFEQLDQYSRKQSLQEDPDDPSI